MKIYLSGPIKDKPDNNKAEFNRVGKILRDMGHEVFVPTEHEFSNDREAFKADLSWICDHAETVVTLDDWLDSAGCRVEVGLANRLGIPHMPLFRFKAMEAWA